ncbi:ankyrin [Pochonia chlamydosporia 170]|uniref:Ankyrin n=1 Tax=Pochonia chlamydosporia 170 TaxID=1380566 RepID=A0A179FHV9_METCM|nr:ankyrin [Pochonia chlamydosporia 170]OAQ65122.1 ankyrin [Pochonia chlamydosporia 170]
MAALTSPYSTLPQGMNIHQWRRMRNSFGSPESALHACVRDDHILELRRLSSRCSAQELEYEAEGFGTPLQVAVLCDNMAAIEVLLHAGADPLVVNPGEETPTSAFNVAIRAGKRDIFNRLWDHTKPGINAATRYPYATFLNEAASYGQAAIVEDLLDWCRGWSNAAKTFALNHAAARWEVHVISVLLSRLDYSQETITYAMHCAVGFKFSLYTEGFEANYDGVDYLHQQQVIAQLIDAGADPNSKPRGENLVIKAASSIDLAGGLKALLEKGADPNGRGRDGGSALHHLGSPVQVRQRPEKRLHETGIRLLIDHGASVTQRDIIGNTPLHFAAFGSNIRVFALYADSLTNHDQDIALAAMENDNGETLLHWAAAGGKADIVHELLSRGLDVNSTTANGWTPLMCSLVPIASMKKSHQVVQAATVLLTHGADPVLCTAEGWTALHCLSLHLDDDAMSYMAQLAEDLLFRGAPLQVPAPMLIRHSTTSSARLHGQDIGLWGSRVQDAMQLAATAPDMVRRNGTPLHWAAYHGAVGVASALLAHGADAFAEDERGNTPARLAVESPLLTGTRGLDARDQLLQVFRDVGVDI